MLPSIKIETRIEKKEDREEMARLLTLFVYNAKNNLRAQKKNINYENYENRLLDNSPTHVMKMIYIKLKQLEKEGQ